MEAPIADDGPDPADLVLPGAGCPSPVYGSLHPTPDTMVDVEVALALLAAHGVLAAIADTPPAPGRSHEFVVMATDSHRAVRLGAGPDEGISEGPLLHEISTALVAATGCAVDLGDLVLTPAHEEFTSSTPLSPEHPGADAVPAEADRPVLLGPFATDHLPLLARHLHGPVEVADVAERTGWRLVRPTMPSRDLHLHRFTAEDLPVIGVGRFGDERFVAVLTHPGHLPGVFLLRQPAWLAPAHLSAARVATYPLTEAERRLVEETLGWFANPHRAPESELRLLRADAGFDADLDLETVATALQSDQDAWWSHRVLTSLGVPTIAAEVHEGRAPMPAAELVEPAGRGAAFVGTLRRPGGRGGRSSRYRED